jgi:hypothetical protein
MESVTGRIQEPAAENYRGSLTITEDQKHFEAFLLLRQPGQPSCGTLTFFPVGAGAGCPLLDRPNSSLR